MTDNRNLILAIVISVLIMVGFQFAYDFFYPKRPLPAPPPQAQTETQTGTQTGAVTAPSAPSAVPPAQTARPEITPPSVSPPGALPAAPGAAAQSREEVLARQPRVPIKTDALHGSISLIGGRLDNLTLVRYRETLKPDSPEIVLLSPTGAPDAYFAQIGWVSAETTMDLPGAETHWTADGTALTPTTPVTLSWTNSAGVVFKRTFSVDENYMFTVRQEVVNPTKESFHLSPYALIARYGSPPVSGYYILHEGPLGVFSDTLKELSYKDLRKENSIPVQSTGGWIGFTDKYWLTALIPAQGENLNFRFLFENYQNRDRYQVDAVGASIAVPAGGSITSENRIFAGAKVLSLLEKYQETYGIPLFDRAIDFGWFWFLTIPIFKILVWLKNFVGNFGIAILLLTVAVKLLFFPLANKSYRAMSKMRKLQPEMTKLKERFADDKGRFNQEMMALYKREKVSPASGCLPMLIQIPVFFSLYKVLFVTIEMRHAPFFGWIQDLSAPDPTSVWNLFGLIPWDPATLVPAAINFGAWPLIMGITMFLQQKLNPQPPDPIQAKVFMFLPVIFTFFLAHFPAGLVIYWAWNNLLSMTQQWVIMKRMGVSV